VCTDGAVVVQLHVRQSRDQFSILSKDKQLFSSGEGPKPLAKPGSYAVQKRQKLEVNHPRPRNVDVKNGRRLTSTNFYVSLTCLRTALHLMVVYIYVLTFFLTKNADTQCVNVVF
jgi:hypothetical protein